IPITGDGRLTVLGDAGVFAGGVGSLDLTGGDDSARDVRVVMGRVGTFTGTTGEDGQCSAMQRARQGHTATVLPDGRVLIAGGEQFTGGERQLLRSVEIFDPNT